jgi:kinesin family protein 6/9
LAGKQVEAVGAEDNKFGFGVGKARKDAKPTTNIENLVNIPKDEFRSAEEQKPDSKVEARP